MSTPGETFVEFPCDFPIKVFGQSQHGFAQAVTEVVLRHDPEFKPASIEMKSSRNARYIGLTCMVHATSQEQLDSIYRDLCDHPMVVMVL